MDRKTSSVETVLPVFLLVFAASLCWPIYLTGQYFIFTDTQSYLRGGERIWDVFFGFFESADATAPLGAEPTGSLVVNEEGRNTTGRSFPYSAFSNLMFRMGGPLLLALAQSILTTFAIWFLITREAMQSPRILLFGAVFVAALSGLPWYASYLMPDVLGGVVLLFGIILVRDIDRLGFLPSMLLLALAGFAASAHYGNIPIMLAVVLAALGMRLLRWRLTWKSVLMGVVAAAVAPAINLMASSVVLEEASVTPQRLPIILARTLNDGPGLWYLTDVCPEADLELCRAYDVEDFTTDTYWLLWSDEGILSLPKEQFDRIRAEEMKVVIGAFKAYPLEQTKALLSNVVSQFVYVGVSQIYVANQFFDDYEPEGLRDGPTVQLLLDFDVIIPWATLAAALAMIGTAVAHGISPRWIDMALVCLGGLAANAFVFGGLSYAVDRYQGRLAWVVPVLAILFIAETLAARRRQTATSAD